MSDNVRYMFQGEIYSSYASAYVAYTSFVHRTGLPGGISICCPIHNWRPLFHEWCEECVAEVYEAHLADAAIPYVELPDDDFRWDGSW